MPLTKLVFLKLNGYPVQQNSLSCTSLDKALPCRLFIAQAQNAPLFFHLPFLNPRSI